MAFKRVAIMSLLFVNAILGVNAACTATDLETVLSKVPAGEYPTYAAGSLTAIGADGCFTVDMTTTAFELAHPGLYQEMSQAAAAGSDALTRRVTGRANLNARGCYVFCVQNFCQRVCN